MCGSGRLFARRFSPLLILPVSVFLCFAQSEAEVPPRVPSVCFTIETTHALVHLLVMVWILTDRPTGRRTSHLEFDQKYLRWRLLSSASFLSFIPCRSLRLSTGRKSPINPHQRLLDGVVRRRWTRGFGLRSIEAPSSPPIPKASERI